MCARRRASGSKRPTRREIGPPPEPDPTWMKAEMEWRKKMKKLSEGNSERIKSSPSPPVLKLTIELVPEPLWWRSLHRSTPRVKWDALRQQVLERFGARCIVCGAAAKIAHEVWEYDDAAHVARLREIIPICELCNGVKHIGLTRKLAARGQAVQSRVEYHFLKVNGCDLETLKQHERQAFETWRERHQHKWTIDYGPYERISRSS